ncbi:MAG: hypothetical protein SRB1_02513 [Desulfobacteraceae bacterium Eth-SRB1]|nr:MAG: hypothetical protein SRB1_02513 [Desulfobacteraceae bacterium Eth-SRB1]
MKSNRAIRRCWTICFITGLLFSVVFVGTAKAGHFPLPVSTGPSCYYSGSFKINGVDGQPGDEVAFFDPDGVLCGLYVLPVGIAGQYGFLHVYPDDTGTPKDEGADPGDPLTVKIWDASAGLEYEGDSVLLTPGLPLGESASSNIPPLWTSENDGFRLNIDTTVHFGDINGDSEINLTDVILVLQIISGIEPAEGIYEEADVNGDDKIGLAEIIYICQVLAGLR